ncbi:MAG: DUF4157 domain-containing protein [Bacteroidota bacterium]
MKTKVSKSDKSSKSSNLFFSGSGDFFTAQPKLKVGQPDDEYEREADRVADQVINRQTDNQSFFTPSQPPVLQTKPLAENITPLVQKQEEEEEEMQAKLIVQKQEEEEEAAQSKLLETIIQKQDIPEEEEMLQTQPLEEEEEMLQSQPLEEEEEELMPKAESEVAETQQTTETNLKDSKGNGHSLDSDTRAQMENSFGADFSRIKIHTDSAAIQMNQELGAKAFTSGNHIYFNEGKYRPGSQNGNKLLAHELVHTVQQGASTTQNQVQRWTWPWASTAEQITDFKSRNYGPLTYTRNEISGSGFEAKYLPAQSRLNITVRGKVRFKNTLENNAGTYSSPNHFMNQAGFIPIMNSLPADVQSRILPYFQWNDEEKQIHMIRFKQNLLAAASLWQDTGMSFQVDESGWESVTATPRINLEITQGDAQHNTREGGFLNLFTVTDESTSDHVQVEIVKQPSADDVANIQRIIAEHNAATGAKVTSGMVQGVRSYLGNDPGSRSSAPQGFNNLMSLESNRSDDPSNMAFYSWIYFEHNESDLSDSVRAQLDSFFSDPMILLDNEDRGIDVNLEGYASAPGTTAYNRSLVNRRIDTVDSYIDDRIMNSNISTNVWTVGRTNDSDTSAESDLATNPETHDPSDYRRVDIEVIRQGRGGQNVFAHELGHVFGLGDEYAEVGSGYNRPAGSRATHDQMARDAGVSGGAIVGNDNRLMSTGNEVGAAHYSTFADALNRLTSKRWKILT